MTHAPGSILRLARESAGVSLTAMARKSHYSKSHLVNVEAGRRSPTKALVLAYEAVLGDDTDRRRLLLTLLAAGTTRPSLDSISKAFEYALDVPPLTVDAWLERLEDYGREYVTTGRLLMQERLAADLSRLQGRLDNPVLAAVAAKLLVLQGLLVQTNVMPDTPGKRPDVLRWYQLASRTADRSGDLATRVWVLGRVALGLATEGAELPAAIELATEALSLTSRPSLGTLKAQMALAHAHGSVPHMEAAKRIMDDLGCDSRVSDFANSEWPFAINMSLMAARIGDEHLAASARDMEARTRPSDAYATPTAMHHARLLTQLGNKEEGTALALETLERTPPKLSNTLMLLEITSHAAT
jgi:transcriptional regulator with XRE-family HTH domain